MADLGTAAALTVLVRGCGDVGSAIAHRLFSAGHRVVIHDAMLPAVTRRGMAFTDAIFDGTCVLDGVHARRLDDVSDLTEGLTAQAEIGVTTIDVDDVLCAIAPDVLVDARMRKRAQPESQLRLATLTIGVGPNFVAGTTTHLAVESQWGDALGSVVTTGATSRLAGEPRSIDGHARGRFVYAPVAGILRTRASIGQAVDRGEAVASIRQRELLAPLDEVLRGLTHDGVPVDVGTKVIEVDPRGERAQVVGIGERPSRIADGVLSAIDHPAAR